MMDFLTPDSKGYVPDPDLIGTKWVHKVRQTTYEIIDFVWHCDNDQWHIQYRSLSNIYPMTFTRTIDNFLGMKDGSPRYIPFS